MSKPIRITLAPTLLRYGGAVALVMLAAGARAALDPIVGDRKRLVCFLIAIMFSAFACGAGPTLLAALLSLVAARFLFIEPRYTLLPVSPGDQVALLIFLLLGLVVALFGKLLQRARERDQWRLIRRHGEEALLESERRFRQLADAMPQMVWTIGPDGNADYFNKRWHEYVGLPAEARGEDSWVPAFHPDDVERTRAAWQAAVASGRPYEMEYRIKDCRTGAYHWFLGRAVPARNEQGHITQWYGTCTDIDELKRAQQALHDAHAEQERRVRERTAELTQANLSMRNLAAQLANAEDRERLRLATDLHDSIGQSLSLLKLNLHPLTQHLAPDSATGSAIRKALALLDDIIKQARTLMFDLYPSMLHDLGLVPTLRWYGEQVKSQAQVNVSEIGAKQSLPPPLVSYLFRAVKELLGNAIRHGKARVIVVAVHWRSKTLRIVIDDDGGGFDPEIVLAPKTQRGLGLAGIKERLLSFSGTMFVESSPGHGARIALEVPSGAAEARETPSLQPAPPPAAQEAAPPPAEDRLTLPPSRPPASI